MPQPQGGGHAGDSAAVHQFLQFVLRVQEGFLEFLLAEASIVDFPPDLADGLVGLGDAEGGVEDKAEENGEADGQEGGGGLSFGLSSPETCWA